MSTEIDEIAPDAFRLSTFLRAAALAAVVSAAVLAGGLSTAEARPGASPQWHPMSGICDGVPTEMSDPNGPGPTNFVTSTGEVGVGRHFLGLNLRTGEVVFEQYYGDAEARRSALVVCDFPVPPDEAPDGTSDWVFRAEVDFAGGGRSA